MFQNANNINSNDVYCIMHSSGGVQSLIKRLKSTSAIFVQFLCKQLVPMHSSSSAVSPTFFNIATFNFVDLPKLEKLKIMHYIHANFPTMFLRFVYLHK